MFFGILLAETGGGGSAGDRASRDSSAVQVGGAGGLLTPKAPPEVPATSLSSAP